MLDRTFRSIISGFYIFKIMQVFFIKSLTILP